MCPVYLSEYDGVDLDWTLGRDMEPKLFGIDAIADLTDDKKARAEAAVQKVVALQNAFQRAINSGGIKGTDLGRIVQSLQPAVKTVLESGTVATVPWYAWLTGPAALLFEGKKSSDAAKQAAMDLSPNGGWGPGRSEYKLDYVIPGTTTATATSKAWLVNQVKERAYPVLMAANDADMDVNPILDTLLTYVGAVQASAEAVGQAMVNVAQGKLPELPELPSLIPTWLKVTMVVGGVALAYGIYKVVLAATPVATAVAAKHYGLSGVSRRHKSVRRHRKAR